MLREHPWEISYSTSDLREDGSVVDILHDFYVPILSRSKSYDRVAGYFSSSSLAIASQGFSQFVNQGGKARFIIGADLDEDDAEAILKGDQQRLSLKLDNQLGHEKTWPADVKRGVELLAWMVTNGQLEIKVGVRQHMQTGEALPFDSQIDGYVHEKWALFSDDSDALYVSGSLNESKTALQINAENLELRRPWTNEENALFTAKKQKNFELIWQGHHPAIKTYSLPEAIRQRFVNISKRLRKLAEIDGSEEKQVEVDKPSNEELLKWRVVADAPLMPNGLFVGMETAPVEPWPHQRVVARRVLERWPANHMLCDEVGLGKTIEAGLIFRSLKLAKVASSIMIAAPASLTRQWLGEMSEKFYLPFKRWDSSSKQHEYIDFQSGEYKKVKKKPAFEPELVIVSTGLFYRKNSLPVPNMDVILVDEAHKARRRNPSQPERPAEFGHFYRSIRDKFNVVSRNLLLATATPMQIHPVEVSDLIRMMPHSGALYRTPDLIDSYYELLNKLRDNSELKKYELDFLRRYLLAIKQSDPLFWEYLLVNVADPASKSQINNWMRSSQTKIAKPMLQRMLTVFFAAAPLSRVMLRHTRSLLEVYRQRGELSANLAKRHVYLKTVDMSKGKEKVIYDELEKYCTELAEKIAELQTKQSEDSQKKSSFAVGFYLTLLRLRFSSSLHALKLTLERRILKVRDTINSYYQVAEGAGIYDTDGPIDWDLLEADENAVEFALKNRQVEDLEWEEERLEKLIKLFPDQSYLPRKTEKLLEIIAQRADGARVKQMVVFTRYVDTMNQLLEAIRFKSPELLIGTFSGEGGRYYDPNAKKMISVERNEIKKRFLQGKIDILICTDAAAEGLNLQTSDLLINFDLPWNPMLVEQRIGRIDRIGQAYADINVYNLCYQGSVEETVYGRLLDRLQHANLIVGSQQISLIPVTEDEFSQLASGKISESQLQEIAEERAERSKEYAKRTEQDAQKLYAIYQREKQRHDNDKLPVRLDDIWELLKNSEYLKAKGSLIEVFDKSEALLVNGISGIPSNTLFTTSRELFEKGLEEEDKRCLVFATYGEPLFDCLLEHFYQFDLPPHISRLEVEQHEKPLVSYVVKQSSGLKSVTSYQDTKGISADDFETISEDDLALMRAQLKDPILDQHQKTNVLEKLCKDAGKHSAIVLGVAARGLLESASEYQNKELFKDALVQMTKDVHGLTKVAEAGLDSKTVPVPEKFVALVKATNQATIFDFEKAANKVNLPVSPVLMGPSLDFAAREGQATKGKMSELRTTSVLTKIGNTIRQESNVEE